MASCSSRRSGPFVAACFVLVACTLTSSPAAGEAQTRIRTFDKDLRALIDDGRARSRTFNAVYEALQQQPVIVFVECSWFLPSDLSGSGRLVASSGGYRSLDPPLRSPYQFGSGRSALSTTRTGSGARCGSSFRPS